MLLSGKICRCLNIFVRDCRLSFHIKHIAMICCNVQPDMDSLEGLKEMSNKLDDMVIAKIMHTNNTDLVELYWLEGY